VRLAVLFSRHVNGRPRLADGLAVTFGHLLTASTWTLYFLLSDLPVFRESPWDTILMAAAFLSLCGCGVAAVRELNWGRRHLRAEFRPLREFYLWFGGGMQLVISACAGFQWASTWGNLVAAAVCLVVYQVCVELTGHFPRSSTLIFRVLYVLLVNVNDMSTLIEDQDVSPGEALE